MNEIRDSDIFEVSVLNKEFYSKNSEIVAKDLIGKLIVSKKDGGLTAGMITETEAYPGDDYASHTYGRRPSQRTKIQYLPGGHLYIYLIMGLHTMLSIVTNNENVPDVVFIRSIEPVEGIEVMRKRRSYFGKDLRLLASGPGRLTKALGIERNDQGLDLTQSESSIYISEYNRPSIVAAGKRINLGISHLTEEEGRITSEKNLRFFLENSNYLS